MSACHPAIWSHPSRHCLLSCALLVARYTRRIFERPGRQIARQDIRSSQQSLQLAEEPLPQAHLLPLGYHLSGDKTLMFVVKGMYGYGKLRTKKQTNEFNATRVGTLTITPEYIRACIALHQRMNSFQINKHPLTRQYSLTPKLSAMTTLCLSQLLNVSPDLEGISLLCTLTTILSQLFDVLL